MNEETPFPPGPTLPGRTHRPATVPGLGSSEVPTTSRAAGLRCSGCGATYPLEERTACERCFGPLHVIYDLIGLRGSRPEEVLGPDRAGLWAFEPLLPAVSYRGRAQLALSSTPLRRAERLGELWGLDDLWIKDDTVLPTGSFKDRPASVAVAVAADRGYPAVGCASTGNLAAATARAAARLGLPAAVLVPVGLPSSKLLSVLVYGGQVIEVDGTYDDANRLANLLGEARRVGLVNVTLRPFYTEGSKTLLFETLREQAWSTPDFLGVPLGSGALLGSTARGLSQARELGWLERGDQGGGALFGSQPQGCAPIAEAFLRGDDRLRPVQRPDTIAESLAIGDPASGPEALEAIRASGGFADAPSPGEVVDAIRAAARWEGVWTEPAGGTVLATLRRKREEGVLDRTDRIVVFLTGAGWKTPSVISPGAREAHPGTVRVSPRARNLEQLISWTPSPAVGSAEQLTSPPEGTW